MYITYTIIVKKSCSTFFDKSKIGRGVIMETYGTIRIKLDELIKKNNISKNKLSHRAEMQRTQINNYCNNKISRLDIDVLARLCTVLNCQIGDLLEFVPTEK